MGCFHRSPIRRKFVIFHNNVADLIMNLKVRVLYASSAKLPGSWWHGNCMETWWHGNWLPTMGQNW